MKRKATAPEMQRRQIIIEEPVIGSEPISVTLRWDGHSQPLGGLVGYTLEQVKRYAAVCQLGREADEVRWTFDEFNGYRVWYSDVMLALNGGLRPSAEQVAAYRAMLPGDAMVYVVW